MALGTWRSKLRQPSGKHATALQVPSECDPQAELDITRARARRRAGHGAEGRGAERRVGSPELNTVERVEHFRPELDPDRLQNLPVLGQGDVPIVGVVMADVGEPACGVE